jgi:hypothetical protein
MQEILQRKLVMWKRSKHIYKEHAQLPTVEDRGDRFRIFYSYRVDGRSYINYFETNKNLDVTYQNKTPVFEPGMRGCFDDCGVMPSCLVGHILYYTGWNLDKGLVPYGHGIGIALWHESLNKFIRISDGPVLDRSFKSPYLVNSPFVQIFDHEWKMWFCNGTGWDGNFPKYNICSYTCGFWNFEQKRDFLIEYGSSNEACSRPAIYQNELYFSKKTKDTEYEICHEGISVLNESNSEWDSKMTCYPYFCGDYMFYNGNGYGASGIGVAINE